MNDFQSPESRESATHYPPKRNAIIALAAGGAATVIGGVGSALPFLLLNFVALLLALLAIGLGGVMLRKYPKPDFSHLAPNNEKPTINVILQDSEAMEYIFGRTMSLAAFIIGCICLVLIAPSLL